MKLDLSSEAIDLRLRQVESLRRLCLSLAQAGRRLRRGAAAPDSPPPKLKR